MGQILSYYFTESKDETQVNQDESTFPEKAEDTPERGPGEPETQQGHEPPPSPCGTGVSFGDPTSPSQGTQFPRDIEDVDRFSIWVVCGGKSRELEVFPLEHISRLKQNACQQFDKSPSKMKLVYDGDYLDEAKRTCEYSLRRGNTVRLMQAC